MVFIDKVLRLFVAQRNRDSFIKHGADLGGGNQRSNDSSQKPG